MKKNKTTIFLVLFFFVGLSILLYPIVSNYYNKKYQSAAIVDYENMAKTYNKEDYTNLLKKAEEYNNKLRKLKNPFYTYDTIENYEKILNIDENGMMGYLTIEKIKVKLPIYHGTDKKVLSKGVGHLKGSSLPVGGSGTHSVLSAHRGLPSSTLFTNLDKLEIGDTFIVKILNKELTYEIDQILIVKPKEIKEIKIKDNGDYITLVTCTPYGINTHRLLVRGKRIENSDKKVYISTEAFKVNNNIVTAFLASFIIFILLMIIILKPSNKKVNMDKYLYPSQYKLREEGNKSDKKD